MLPVKADIYKVVYSCDIELKNQKFSLKIIFTPKCVFEVANTLMIYVLKLAIKSLKLVIRCTEFSDQA